MSFVKFAIEAAAKVEVVVAATATRVGTTVAVESAAAAASTVKQLRSAHRFLS